MSIIRRSILTLALSASLAPAFAQVPPPVPALPDTERRTTYSISASTCACNVNFALYGDSTDYANWIEVFVNGVRMSQAGNWTLSSATGTIGSIPLPITNAVLTFTAPQTGTIQIVGARRPRRTSQFNEGAGVPTRNFNVVLSDLTAQNRELWDKTNDVTGRALMSQPGNTISTLPLPSVCAGKFLGFDATGLIPQCSAGTSIGATTAPQGRLTLASAVPVTQADVAASTSVFYAFDGNGGSVPINGQMTSFTQLTLTLNTGVQLNATNYDYFIGLNGASPTLCTGPSWNSGAVAGSNTARGTGAGSTDIQQTGGFWVNTNSMTCSFGSSTITCAVSACTYVGTGRMTANGQTEDSFAKRFLWNAYNQVPRPMRVVDATASWPYGTAVIRQANANTANQLAFVSGLVGSIIDAEVEITVQNSTATARSINFGIGIDSTTTYTQVTAIASCTNAGFTNNLSKYRGFPGLGFHVANWNETGAGTDTQTWFGSPFSQLTGSIGG